MPKVRQLRVYDGMFLELAPTTAILIYITTILLNLVNFCCIVRGDERPFKQICFGLCLCSVDRVHSLRADSRRLQNVHNVGIVRAM